MIDTRRCASTLLDANRSSSLSIDPGGLQTVLGSTVVYSDQTSNARVPDVVASRSGLN
jgi:hypothetical protein